MAGFDEDRRKNAVAQDPAGEERWMTVKDVAGYLQLSTDTVYKLAQDGKIPACKIVGVWRFKREAIDAWVKQGADIATLP